MNLQEYIGNPQNRLDAAQQIEFLLLHNQAREDGVISRDRKLIKMTSTWEAVQNERDIASLKIIDLAIKTHLPGRQISKVRNEIATILPGLAGIGPIFRPDTNYPVNAVAQDYAITSIFNCILLGGMTAKTFPPISLFKKDDTVQYRVMKIADIESIKTKINLQVANGLITDIDNYFRDTEGINQIGFGTISSDGIQWTDLTRMRIMLEAISPLTVYQIIRQLGIFVKRALILFQSAFPRLCICMVYPELTPEEFKDLKIGEEDAGGED